jgi:hypothetical protein
MKSQKPKKRGRPIVGKVSQKTMAGLAGVTVKTLLEWRKLESIDITNKAAVMARAATAKRKEPTGTPTDGSESYTEARRRREIANANRAEILADRERGRFVEVAEAHAVINLLDHCVCIIWKGVGRELPNYLDGLTASQMVTAINKFVDEILVPRFAHQLQSGLKRLAENQTTSP